MDAFADGEDIFAFISESKAWYRCNTVTKELSEPLAVGNPFMYVGGFFYCCDGDDKKYFAYDKTGALVYREELGEDWYSTATCVPLEKGFLVSGAIIDQGNVVGVIAVISYDLKERHFIPAPEQEVGHGIKEPIEGFDKIFSVGGDAYGIPPNYNIGGNTVFKLNSDTWEWEEFDTTDDDGRYRMTGTNGTYQLFYGRYVYSNKGIFDILTGEQVFSYDEQYPAPRSYTTQNYIAGQGVYIIWRDTHRLVDLHLSGISEKWARPKNVDDMAIVDATHVVYWDTYGCFLWNALDGTEETIMLFGN